MLSPPPHTHTCARVFVHVPSAYIAFSYTHMCTGVFKHSRSTTNLGSNSVRACGEEFSNTGCLESLLYQTEGGSKPRPTSAHHHGIVGVVNHVELTSQLHTGKQVLVNDTRPHTTHTPTHYIHAHTHTRTYTHTTGKRYSLKYNSDTYVRTYMHAHCLSRSVFLFT